MKLLGWLTRKTSEERSTNPRDATNKAFRRARRADTQPVEEPYRPFNEVAYAWGTKRLWRGTKGGIRELVRQNLDRISRKENFRYFAIDMLGDSVVQISATFSRSFIGVQLWRAGREYFTNGNSDFNATGVLAKDNRIRMESGEKDEAEQRRKIRSLREDGIRLTHTLCGKNFSVEECEIARVEDTSVCFRCPICRVQALHFFE